VVGSSRADAWLWVFSPAVLRGRPVRMADAKTSASPISPQRPDRRPDRDRAIAGALDRVLLPDLTALVRAYDLRPGHRLNPRTAPREVMISADGLSASLCGSRSDSESVIWSRDTLRTGAHRWSVHLRANTAPFWIGVGDMRRKKSGSDSDESLSVGNWMGCTSVMFYTMSAVPEPVRYALNFKTAFARRTAAVSLPTVVQMTYDEEARTVRMEIAGEPDAGSVVFTDVPAPEFLCPIVMFDLDSLQAEGSFSIESDDE
jgi:hypothetical protein